jgi:hypothetical protein
VAKGYVDPPWDSEFELRAWGSKKLGLLPCELDLECLQSGLSEIEEQRLHQRAEKARELILGACRTVKRVIGRSRDKETIS